jgi:hypothetical protein
MISRVWIVCDGYLVITGNTASASSTALETHGDCELTASRWQLSSLLGRKLQERSAIYANWLLQSRPSKIRPPLQKPKEPSSGADR